MRKELRAPAKHAHLTNQQDDFSSHFITIIFSKSPSTHYPNALFVAESADYFYTKELARKKYFHVAGFKKESASVAKAYILLKYCSAWNGTLCFINGVARLPWQALSFLQCYSVATASDNPVAHCYTAAQIVGTEIKAIISCRLAMNYSLISNPKNYSPEELLVGIPASFAEQLQADAVRTGCDQCPNFKAEVFIPKTLQESKKYWT